MANNNISNNEMSNHIDKSVIRLFLIVFLISVSVLAYRVTEYTPCKQVEFKIISDNFLEGTLIEFKDKTANATSWEWDFGDGSKVGTHKEALHSFDKPGEYNITLKINGICEDIQQVVIEEKPFVVDTTKLAIFSLPETIEVGTELSVIDKTPNAATWEWRFGETAGVNSTEKRAKYTYESGGLKTVSLIINGDVKHVTSKKIRVIEKKKIEGPEEVIKPVERTVPIKKIGDAPTGGALGGPSIPDGPKTYPIITDTNFKNQLNLVADKKLKPSAFKPYFCGDIDMPILVNGENTTFLKLCELIISKKLKIKTLTLYKEDNNCIKNITLTRTKYLYK